MRKGFYFIAALLVLGIAPVASAQLTAERALYLSGNQTLMGCIYRPKGKGPFPAVVFNQNTAKALNQSGVLDPFPQLAKVFVSKGYVLFIPGRHAGGNNQDDEEKGKKDSDGKVMENHEANAANILAAVAWVKAQHDVDDKRVSIVADCAGAVSTLFAASKGLDVAAVVLFSPGTKKLKSSYEFQVRLKDGVQACAAPIFLIQPENDFNLLPKTILGPILTRKGNFNDVKVYPPFGDTTQEAHRFAMEGQVVWQRDVISFLRQVMN
jgi:carboxymethylenebutenolidase